MRYLTENNDYRIMYDPEPMLKSFYSDIRYIYAYLSDKTADNFISDYEKYNGELEPCLMKLGKRLIRRWQNQKK